MYFSYVNVVTLHVYKSSALKTELKGSKVKVMSVHLEEERREEELHLQEIIHNKSPRLFCYLNNFIM